MNSLLFGLVRGFWRRNPSPYRAMRSSGFKALDPTKRIEEERMPAYERNVFYPVNIGDIFCARYQVLSKLGFGANSTVWFCRDFHQHRYIALKIYIHDLRPNREVEVLKHLSDLKTRTKHVGGDLIRTMLDAFEIEGPKGNHHCLVFEPLLTSLFHFQATLDPPSLTEDLLKALLQQLLLALDFLHSEAEVVHTDIQAKNIMIGTGDSSIFSGWEKSEKENPSSRKVVHGRTIYQSQSFSRRKVQNSYGLPLLSDFGEARVGKAHSGIIQPDLYRAPEVLLGMNWTSKVDIWNVGTLIWDLFEDHHLFDGRGPDKQHSDLHLLAEMTAILGPPPACFLRKSLECQKYWDQSGKWNAQVSVPETSLEDSEEYLQGENRVLFLQFMRKMLQWNPDDRQSAYDLLKDPWLNSP